MMRKTIAALACALVWSVPAQVRAEEPLLAPMFQDHAVLQRGQPIRVWGQAPAGERVDVSIAEARATARADTSGRWSARLPAMSAGGPYTLTARAGNAAQTVNDVLVGDVWLCSGQSNMVLEVRRTLDSRAEIANSANDTLRMLTVPMAHGPTPQQAFAVPVQWQVAGPATVSEWSATCFYFARELQRTVRVPMGMVNAAWGGANIRAWMSTEALRGTGDFDEGLDILELYASDTAGAYRRWGAVWENWWRTAAPTQAEPWAPGARVAWRRAPDELAHWERWGEAELESFNGTVWYRANVRLNAQQAMQSAQLSLGTIDEIDATWVNGVFVGAMSGAGDRRNYTLAPGLLRAGDNLIVVAATDTYATGGIYGPAEARALRFENGASAPLTDWRYWQAPVEASYPPRLPWEATGGLGTIHNGMIAPIGPYNFRGVVWYQGESNTGEPERYRGLLHAFMADWRGKYGAEVPFLIVQLADYGPASTAPVNSGTAGVREAQRLAVLDDGRAGLAVAIDLGERGDIHPANKQDVGRRLARAARRVVYGEAIAPSGPVPVRARRSGGGIVVEFTDVERELVAYGASRPVGFELCGPTQESCAFVDARIAGPREVALTISAGLTPTRVRLCWADSPVCTLYDRANLPAGPFELAIE